MLLEERGANLFSCGALGTRKLIRMADVILHLNFLEKERVRAREGGKLSALILGNK